MPVPTVEQLKRWYSGPSWKAVAVDLGDDTDFGDSLVPRSLYVGGAGDVKVKDLTGADVTFAAVPVGTVLPVAVTFVYSTAHGTTASNLVALF